MEFLSNFMIYEINHLCCHTSISSRLNKFQEKPISRWMTELVSINDHKNFIQRDLDILIFEYGSYLEL